MSEAEEAVQNTNTTADTGASSVGGGNTQTAEQTQNQRTTETGNGASQNPSDGLLSEQAGNTAGSGAGDKPNEKPATEADGNGFLGKPEGGYTFSELPEGSDMSVVEKWSEAAGEMNLSQDASQKLFTAGLEGLKERVAKQRSQMREASLADKELDFANPETQQCVQKAFRTYVAVSPALAQKLSQLNLDVDPDFIKFMKAVGKDIGGGANTFVTGNRGTRPDETDFRAMYPNTNMNR